MHKNDKHEAARRLFIDSGMTYDQISRELRISASALKDWGMKGKWNKERRAYRRSNETLDASVAKAKGLIVDKLLKVFNGAAPFDSQAAYATCKAGVLLLLLQADRWRGNPKAVLDLLEALNSGDERVRSILKRRGTNGER